MHALTAILLALPITALAGNPHEGSQRRKHWETRNVAHARRGVTYQLEDDYSGQNFFDGWTFDTEADPTHGLVDFVSDTVAQVSQLAYVQSDNTVVVAVDDTTNLTAGANRNSIRITTKKTYNGGLFVADFFAMPHGCGVWPAYWSVGPNWPEAGEIDILEGVNLQTDNQITLHSSPNCTITNADAATGHLVNPTCTSSNGNNAGCAYAQSGGNSFGHGFNMMAGGVFAHLWDQTGISVWFFPRTEIPQDISSGNPDPSSWGAPVALFPNNDSCDTSAHFHDHSLVIDTTLCGDWAGNSFGGDGCPGTCADFILNANNFQRKPLFIISI
ncbi:hypothetical protein PHLCEN_2v9942 [Hermanssonia centrifuga]|uniref:GH16 domain-containing protein n=1 Tax=Hermanssonia centrifuga TaxID=98765 RepID=A0A2R6NPD7_9APHY|nr:hypothetical protein PHLCEN_2v9942 [Hermanssonia centrifuga]